MKTVNPFTFPNREWQLKPQPKPDIVWYRVCYSDNTLSHSYDSFGDAYDDNLGINGFEILKFTRSGEKGKLIVEVIDA